MRLMPRLALALAGSLLSTAPVVAGPLLDAAMEAERLAAANDARGAFEAMRSGLATFSQTLPLTVPRALFVTEVPKAYRAYEAKAEPVFIGKRTYTPAPTMMSAMRIASGRGSTVAASAAPRKPKTRAAAHTGSEMRQSMLPRRW